MEPLIIESYEHYKRRKNTKYWIAFAIIITIAFIFFAFKDLGYNDLKDTGPELKHGMNTPLIYYEACLKSCNNTYILDEDELVEMTEACELIKIDEKKDFGGVLENICAYRATSNMCECLDEYKTMDDCTSHVVDYLKEIGCA